MAASVVPDHIATPIEKNGFAIVSDALSSADVTELLTAVQGICELVVEKGRAGARGLVERAPVVHSLARHAFVRGAAVAVLGSKCFPVRALIFDKTPTANWKVAWHQDLTIAVRARRDVDGYGPWSIKAGVPHVQPPIAVLEQMVAVRVHLDECGPENGPVRVLPGSHRSGLLRPADIELWRQGVEAVSCVVSRGGLLVMRPLLLHASSQAKTPRHRRVIHLEFAAAELAPGLEWWSRGG
jgi:phytanoyl-CoA dioxygenase PhyH